MSLLDPDLMLPRITDLTPEHLAALHLRGLLLDVDNTIALPNAPHPIPGLLEWLEVMRDAGIGIALISNNRGKRVGPLAAKLGLPFVANGFKPLAWGIYRAARMLALPKREIALAGDQLYTDVLGAHLSGMYAIWVHPLHAHEGRSIRLRRRLEHKILNRNRS